MISISCIWFPIQDGMAEPTRGWLGCHTLLHKLYNQVSPVGSVCHQELLIGLLEQLYTEGVNVN